MGLKRAAKPLETFEVPGRCSPFDRGAISAAWPPFLPGGGIYRVTRVSFWRCEMLVQRFPYRLSQVPQEDHRDIISKLNSSSDKLGCAIFGDLNPGESATIIFAGNLERFLMLATARHVNSKVIYFQDPHQWWYQGSSILPELGYICETFLVKEAGLHPIIFGQSSGGYAALAASCYFPSPTVVACSPQTFSDREDKEKIRLANFSASTTPDGLIDIRSAVENHRSSGAYRAVISSASEHGNPITSHFWMDYLHTLRLVGVKSVKVHLVNDTSHSIVNARSHIFAGLLAELFEGRHNTINHKEKIVQMYLDVHFPSPK